MGYRSEVRCLIYGEPNKVDAMIMAWHARGGLNLWAEEHFGTSMTEYVIDHEGAPLKIINLYGGDWKWYEGYTDVDAWTRFMNTAEEFGCEREFLRIGEEYTDIETEHTENSHYWLSCSCMGVCDAPEPPEEERQAA